jgi:hypothetical protein
VIPPIVTSPQVRRPDFPWRDVWTVVAVLVVIGLWQTRYTWNVGTPMYGWPFCYENLWYLGQHQSSWRLFFADALVWVVISASAVQAARRLRAMSKPVAVRFTLRTALLGQATLAVLFALAIAERACHARMGTEGVYPPYGRIGLPNGPICIDVGLFVGRFDTWVSVRLAMIALVACTAYRLLLLVESIGRTALSALRRTPGEA